VVVLVIAVAATVGISLALASTGRKPLAGTSAKSPAGSGGRPARFTVQRATVGPAIPNGFVGLSMEFRGLEAYAGSNPAALSGPFLQLMRNLAPGGSPGLRIGGDGTDWTWYPVPHMAQPGGVKYSLDRNWLKVARAVSQALNARLILGINLEADSRRLAATEGRTFVDGIGRQAVQALELGNEPELYGSFPWYKNAAGIHIRGRPSGYDFQAYLRDFSSFSAVLPRVPVAGPSSGSKLWNASLGSFLSSQRRVRLVTLHAYPLKHCTHASHPTLAQLIAPAASAGLAASQAGYVAVARHHGLGVRLDELNGISCGGARGVSDSFASALWVLDALYQLARVGVVGVNIHTVPKTINEVIGSNQVRGKWQAVVHPEYYGMMMFARAAPAGSRLLRVSAPRGASGISVWAARAADGHLHAVVTNRRATPQNVAVRLPGAGGPASLERLQAPRLGATSGVTLGGQSFGSATTTGTLGGPRSESSIKPGAEGYVVSVPGCSAAMLTL
jgi:hypothetical protein